MGCRRIGVDPVLLETQTEINHIRFGKRDAELQVRTHRDDPKTRVAKIVERIGGAIVDIGDPLDPVHCEIRVGLRDAQRAARRRGIHVQCETRTRAEYIVLRHPRRDDWTFARTIAQAQRNRAGRFFRYLHVDVCLIRHSFDRHGRYLHIGEVTQPVDAVFRQRQTVCIEPCAFKLAHFAAHHFVAGTRVTRNFDVAHVYTTARIDLQCQVDRVMLLIDLGHGVHRGKRVSVLAEFFDDSFRGRLQPGCGEAAAHLDRDEPAQLRIAIQQVTG